MPFSSGTFSLASGNPVTTGTTISSTWANNTLSDLATGLSSCVLKDGTQTITANIPMSSFKFTGLGAGSAAGDSLRYEQVFTTGTLTLLGSVSVTGSLNIVGAVSASGSLAIGTTLYAASASVTGSIFVGATVSVSGALNLTKAATLTATATVAIGAATGNYAVVTGTATVSGFDSANAGVFRIIEWSGATPLDNNANLILPGNANLTTAAGDMSLALSDGAAIWRLMHQKASGAPILMTPTTNSLGANVSCSATGTMFTGPTVAQGTVGTWFASGVVTFVDSGAAGSFRVKLWDGTTTISSTEVATTGANNSATAHLSGYITNPAGNIRMSVQDITSTSGAILFNQTGTSKDSTLTVIRIA